MIGIRQTQAAFCSTFKHAWNAMRWPLNNTFGLMPVIFRLMLAMPTFFGNLGVMTSRFVALLLVLSLLTISAWAQDHTTGIFATIKMEKKHKTKNYGRRVFNRSNREKFLIPEIPLIASNDFLAVTEITHDLKSFASYLSITVTAEGLQKLRNAVQSLTNIELILLIDNTVFGRISSNSEDDFRFNKITIVSPLRDENLEWAHQKLTEMINARKQE